MVIVIVIIVRTVMRWAVMVENCTHLYFLWELQRDKQPASFAFLADKMVKPTDLFSTIDARQRAEPQHTELFARCQNFGRLNKLPRLI